MTKELTQFIKSLNCCDWLCVWRWEKDVSRWSREEDMSGRAKGLFTSSHTTLPVNELQQKYKMIVTDVGRWYCN